MRTVLSLAAVGLALMPGIVRGDDGIHEAASKGDVARVKALLDADPTLVHEKYEFFGTFRTPLHDAVACNQFDVVRLLLARHADVTISPPYFGTPLEVAVWDGKEEMAAVLLAGGAKLDIRTAAGLGRTELVRQILDRDPKLIDTKDSEDRTALHWAVHAGRREVVVLLLARHARQDKDSWWKEYTPLHYAVEDGRDDLAPLLIAHGADINAHEYHDLTPLHLAVNLGRLRTAALLLEKGADVNAVTVPPPGTSRIAVANGITCTSYEGPSADTPLHLAALGDDVKMVELLLCHGADVNARSGFGTPLKLAVQFKKTAVAEVLRRAGGRE
jgi:ankyrin repeat protein